MRPGAPRAAAGGEPCHGSIIAFWTCPLSDQGRDLRGLLGLSQTTAPDMPGSQKGLPPPACPANRKLEKPRSIPRRALWVGLRGRERRGGKGGEGRGWGVAWRGPKAISFALLPCLFSACGHVGLAPLLL